MSETLIGDQQTILGYLNTLKSSLYEESKKWELLSPFIHDIRSALEAENYPQALHLIDELEEMMDLEFCQK